jgi:hypothetical protein
MVATDPDPGPDRPVIAPGTSGAPNAAGISGASGDSGAPRVAGSPDVTGAPTSQDAAGVDPLTAPLTYPGTPPWRPAVLVTSAAVLALQPRDDAPLGEWLLQTDVVATPLSALSPGPLPRDALSGGAVIGGAVAGNALSGGAVIGGAVTGRADFPDAASTDEATSEIRVRHVTADPAGTDPEDANLQDADPYDVDPAGVDAQGNDPEGSGFGGAVVSHGSDLQEVSLDQYLRNVGGAPVASLVPVLAVGSNASPAQVRRKLAHAGLPTLVPITAVSVGGLAVGVSAHVSRPGYLPATPVPDDDAVSNLWLVWLDADALTAIDATEPNYERIRLSAQYPVRLTTGQTITRCWVYRSRHGYLVTDAGEPRRLTDQATLISALLAGVPALRPLAGASPQEWIERSHDAAVREAIREAFRDAGLVRSPAGL